MKSPGFSEISLHSCLLQQVPSKRIVPVLTGLRHYATNRQVAGSFPDGVLGIFQSHYGPGVDSASNRNEYQVYFLGVKAAGA
jgi:hypothetical protein